MWRKSLLTLSLLSTCKVTDRLSIAPMTWYRPISIWSCSSHTSLFNLTLLFGRDRAYLIYLINRKSTPFCHPRSTFSLLNFPFLWVISGCHISSFRLVFFQTTHFVIISRSSLVFVCDRWKVPFWILATCVDLLPRWCLSWWSLIWWDRRRSTRSNFWRLKIDHLRGISCQFGNFGE